MVKFVSEMWTGHWCFSIVFLRKKCHQKDVLLIELKLLAKCLILRVDITKRLMEKQNQNSLLLAMLHAYKIKIIKLVCLCSIGTNPITCIEYDFEKQTIENCTKKIGCLPNLVIKVVVVVRESIL